MRNIEYLVFVAALREVFYIERFDLVTLQGAQPVPHSDFENQRFFEGRSTISEGFRGVRAGNTYCLACRNGNYVFCFAQRLAQKTVTKWY